MIILHILFFSLLIVCLLNLLLNYKQRSKYGKIEAGSSEYYSLRLRIDVLITSLTIVLAAAAFIGVNTVKGIEDNFKEQVDDQSLIIENQKETVKELEDRLLTIEESLQESQNGIMGLLDQVSTSEEGVKVFISELQKQLKPQRELINKLENQANEIQRSISYSNFFVVDNIITDGKPKTRDFVYFKDIKTIDGQRLPKFEHPPLILVWVDLELKDRGYPLSHAADCDTSKFILPNYFGNERIKWNALIVYPIKPT